MPDPITHYIFAREVVDMLPATVREKLDLPVLDRAAQGPDPWSSLQFYGGKYKPYSARSGQMHSSHAAEYLTALAEQVRQTGENLLLCVLLGNICHYCLDKTAHPYIIAKSGWSDGTKQTAPRLGGHIRLERAIDSYYIRQLSGKKPWRFPVARYAMLLRQYPAVLKEPLNDVFHRVYGWENAFDLFNRSLRDERRFYTLMQDPFGIVHYLLRLVSGGRVNYSLYSYYQREIDSDKLDYLNLKHKQWCNPFAPELIYTESFPDLFRQAKEEAAAMICGVLRWLEGDRTIDLPKTFGNCNYSSGLDCQDVRNGNIPVCQPLPYYGKYRNHKLH